MDRRQLLNDTEETQRIILEGFQSSLWTAIPCIVESVNLNEMTIEAQPAIRGTVENERGELTSVNLPKLVDVPITFQSAGGFTITLPIAKGDECLVIFASRCIDAWWQSGGINVPAETRMHDLSDGFAIFGPKSLPKKISGISSTALQIRNDAGTSYVELSADGKIKLVSPSEIDINGNLKVTGTISATGEVTANSATTPIPLSTHKHTGVTTGGGTSGPPTP